MERYSLVILFSWHDMVFVIKIWWNIVIRSTKALGNLSFWGFMHIKSSELLLNLESWPILRLNKQVVFFGDDKIFFIGI